MRNLRTTARRDGDDWIIDGHKMWIGNGGIANVHVVNAVVDEELGHRGQALFVVPGGTPGLELVRKLDKLGCRASHTAELKFNGVRDSRQPICSAGTTSSSTSWPRLAKWSQGPSTRARRRWAPSNRRRPMVAAQALGIARAALEYATEYANRREAFGAPIIDNQGIAFPLADLATKIDAARLLTWRASWMAATGVPFERGEGSMSKLAASEVAVETTERAIQTMGGYGYIKDHPVEKWYRDAKLYTIFEGTSEIQRIVISHALGAADGKPPLHVDLEPTGGPLNALFGRGTPARTRLADAALGVRDRVPRPVMNLAMKVLRPPPERRTSRAESNPLRGTALRRPAPGPAERVGRAVRPGPGRRGLRRASARRASAWRPVAARRTVVVRPRTPTWSWPWRCVRWAVRSASTSRTATPMIRTWSPSTWAGWESTASTSRTAPPNA